MKKKGLKKLVKAYEDDFDVIEKELEDLRRILQLRAEQLTELRKELKYVKTSRKRWFISTIVTMILLLIQTILIYLKYA